MTQLALVLTHPEEPPRPPTLEERWQAFDRENPQVWRAFERFTWDAIRAGRERIGAKAIWERMRWWSSVETTGDEYRLNNSWVSFYARKFRKAYPEHAHVFATRERAQ